MAKKYTPNQDEIEEELEELKDPEIKELGEEGMEGIEKPKNAEEAGYFEDLEPGEEELSEESEAEEL
jgi:hypothetical protein